MFKAFVIGNLTADPTSNTTKNGTPVTNFTVAHNAVNDNECVDYIRVSVFGGQAEACAEYLYKGSRVAVLGNLHCELFEGEKGVHLSELLTADAVQFLSAKKEESNTKKNNTKYRR